MVFQAFGLVDGEDAYAVHLTAGDGFAAKGFVPVADEAGQFGRIALQILSPSIEEAAISLGASDMTTFRKITVPMMMPGVLSGAIMSWVTIISELSSSIILYTNSTQTLTVSIYTEVIRGNYGNASAYATILTVTSILSLLLFYKVTGRRDVSV